MAKIIVASAYWVQLYMLGKYLETIDIECIHYYPRAGVLDRRQRRMDVCRFASPCSTARICLLQVPHGAHGLDLSCASHVLLLEPIADVNLEQQVISRAHRMGALRDVYVEVFVVRGSVDELTVRNRDQWQYYNKPSCTETSSRQCNVKHNSSNMDIASKDANKLEGEPGVSTDVLPTPSSSCSFCSKHVDGGARGASKPSAKRRKTSKQQKKQKEAVWMGKKEGYIRASEDAENAVSGAVHDTAACSHDADQTDEGEELDTFQRKCQFVFRYIQPLPVQRRNC